jgi:hypothetical protein
VEIQEHEVRAWTLMARAQQQKALQEMRVAVELEDGTEKSAVTPGPLAPARELLGEMLLETHQPAVALEQFEATLKQEPGRFRALYGAGYAARLAGRTQTSRGFFRQLVNNCERGDKPGRAEFLDAEKAVSQDQSTAQSR